MDNQPGAFLSAYLPGVCHSRTARQAAAEAEAEAEAQAQAEDNYHRHHHHRMKNLTTAVVSVTTTPPNEPMFEEATPR